MDNLLLDKLKCPICLEYPRKEIYQCINGHSLCSVCCGRVIQCPSCRTAFATGMVRNRAIEDLLDSLVFDCTYKINGCQAQLNRGVLSDHVLTCMFSPSFIKYCEQIGMSCAARLSTPNSKLTIDHMRSFHNAVVKNSLPTALQIKMPSNSSWMHSNLIFSDDGINGIFIHLDRALEEGNILFSILNFGESMTDKYAVQLTVKTPNPALLPEMKSVVVPYDAKHSMYALRNPCFRVPISYAMENLVIVYYDLLKQASFGSYEIMQ